LRHLSDCGLGVPIGMHLLMQHDWNKQVRLVKGDKKSRVIPCTSLTNLY
jgi:hypothetical protein